MLSGRCRLSGLCPRLDGSELLLSQCLHRGPLASELCVHAHMLRRRLILRALSWFLPPGAFALQRIIGLLVVSLLVGKRLTVIFSLKIVESILFQVIFTGVVKCNQYFQVLFAHVHLQSKYKFSLYSSNGASIRKSTVDGRLYPGMKRSPKSAAKLS